MHLRPMLAATLGALVLTLLSPVGADADTRVPVFGDLPSGVAVVQSACGDGSQPAGEPEPAAGSYLVSGPSTPPLHDDSLTIYADDDRMPGLAVELASGADLATLEVAQHQGIHLYVSVRLADGTWLPTRGVMSTGTDFGWRWFDAGDATASDLGPVTAYLWFGTCSGDRSVTVDALSVGAPGDVTTYDFESSSLTLEGVGGSWAEGEVRRWHSCSLRSGFDPVAGQPVVMESRVHGRGAFKHLGTAKTGKYGQVSFADWPHTTMDYRCRYAGNDGTTGPPAPALETAITTLKVQTHLSIRVRRTDHGRGVLATGLATPRHPGTRVTLYARRVAWDATSRVLDRGRLSRRGTYELSGRLGRGPWLVYVKVAKAPGNSAGPSASRYMK